MNKAEIMIRRDHYGKFNSTIKEIKIGNERWRYSVSGNGNHYILALMSNVAGHVFALPLAEALQEHYRVIALSIPPLPSFHLSGDGLAAVLKHENITCCDAIGHSNGGVHIQNLIASHPQMVDKIIFSHSLTSMSAQDAYTVNNTEVELYRKAKILMKIFPTSILLNALGGQFTKKIKLAAGEKDTSAMQKLFKAELKLLNKKDLLLIVECMEDFLFNYTFDKKYYQEKAGKILLLNSPTDRIVNPRQEKAMRMLCPQAQTYQFKKGGHTSMLTCPEEYYEVVKHFLLK